MEFITNQVELVEFVIGDFDAFWIRVGIQCTVDRQAGASRRRCNQVHNDFMTDEGFTSPVL